MRNHPELAAIRGEVEASLAARTTAQPTEPEAAREVQAETVEDIEESIGEQDEETLEMGSSPEVGDQGDDDEGVLHRINDIPEFLGIEPEAFYGLPFHLKDGKEMSFGDAKERLQTLDDEYQRLEQQRAELEQQRQYMQQSAAQSQQQQQVLSERERQAEAQLMALNQAWQASEGKWQDAADKGQVAYEQNQLREAYGRAQAELEAARQESQQVQNQQREQWYAQQHQALAQRIPDWADRAKREKIQGEIMQFARETYGYDPAELAGIGAREVLVMRDAMEGSKLRKGAETAVKGIKARAPVVPPTARRGAMKAQQKRVAELSQRALETGKTTDRLAAARALLGR